MKKNKNIIIWDWNGTLLNDATICLDGINLMLEMRNVAALSMERYRQIFTFPIKNYYQAAGFDFEKEPFEIPAEEFILHYKRLLPLAGLFHDVVDTLEYFNKLGYRQFIVSAMEQNALAQSVSERGIDGFFEAVWGIENNLAHSKVHRAMQLIKIFDIEPRQALIVGDTLHDAEVANELGIDIVLISRGHQNPARLSQNGNLLFPDLAAFVSYMENLRESNS